MKMTSKIKMTSKKKDDLKNKDDIRNEDNHKNGDILNDEDNTKMSMASTTLPENFLMTPQLDKHSKTNPKPEMLSAV